MTIVKKNEISYSPFFDKAENRLYINGAQSVFHCHHYMCLYTQLALDAKETTLLQSCSRDSFREVLDNYFLEHKEISKLSEKIEIACQYYALVGLGQMIVNFLGENYGEVELITSHLDQGWIKKWGKYDAPVNYITAGFIEATFASILNLPNSTFHALEQKSIVMGEETSLFKVSRR